MVKGENSETGYIAEVERLRSEGVVGRSGRLRELFDYLADRGDDRGGEDGSDTESASQADIAKAVFQQDQTDADDATVRVYVHRLRKKLDDHYAKRPPGEEQAMLEIPAGIYALRLVVPEIDSATRSEAIMRVASKRTAQILVSAVLAVLAAFATGWWLSSRPSSVNAIWQPVIASERPVLLVLGDYYMFGEIDPVRPEEGRLIRDFRINSPADLLALQEAEPTRYNYAEDFGINYLPFSAAYGLSNIAPLLEGNGKQVSVIASSDLDPDMLNYFDIVYVGLLSGLSLLEDQAFTGSSLRLGESYDELIDIQSGQRYVSDEARSLASPAFYRDYAYVSRFAAPGGGSVTIIASERDTGLRGLSPLVTGSDLPGELEQVAKGGDPFEALVQITGQQGADLNERLILARRRE